MGSRPAGNGSRGRTGPRLIAAVALLVGVGIAVVVAVLVIGRGGDDAAHGNATVQSPSAGSAASASRAALPSIAEVRNARPQPDWAPYSGPVPILRYDVVGKPKPGEAFPELFVPPADFRAQLEFLEAEGYEAVGLETVQAAWSGGGALPAKPIVLSFDGITGDLLKVAVPELRRRGWPGVLVIDAEAPLPPSAAVARLIALGWDVEPSGRDPGAARRLVKAHFPAAAHNFAAPSPESSDPPIAAVKTAGFSGATTAIGGGFAEASHPFKMPRITIFGLSKIEGFEETLRSHGRGAGA
jgi:peptidoglycan/xylan/chitin deacetylase (PgdA/CDA1 family)